MVLLVLGCFMETLAIMIILVPILIPVLNQFQIDLTHFGIILLVNLTIGQLTPPVGVLLFVASSGRQGPARTAGAGGGAVRRGADRGVDGDHQHSRPLAVAAERDQVIPPRRLRRLALGRRPLAFGRHDQSAGTVVSGLTPRGRRQRPGEPDPRRLLGERRLFHAAASGGNWGEWHFLSCGARGAGRHAQ